MTLVNVSYPVAVLTSGFVVDPYRVSPYIPAASASQGPMRAMHEGTQTSCACRSDSRAKLGD
jgi:hypothetical protein